MPNIVRFFLITFFYFFSLSVFSQENAVDETSKKQLFFTTKHTIDINGKPLDFTAIADEIFLKNNDNKVIASVFSFSYIKKSKKNEVRPVIFIFNGGPGSSSIWLHLSSIAPWKVKLTPEINSSNLPPFELESNTDCLLDVADLVFVDPVGTGYSHIIFPGTPQDFYGVDQDAESMAQFIEKWLNKNNRWNSPKFLIGESYGSQRVSVLPRALMGGVTYSGVMRGITLNGIIMLGTTLESPLKKLTVEAKLERAASLLPTLAKTAWYYNKINKTPYSYEEFQKEVVAFAERDYLNALLLDNQQKLSVQERSIIIDKLCTYTGLSKDFFSSTLEITPKIFSDSLLLEENLQIGLYDTRYNLPLEHSGNDPVADDPSMARYVPGFTAAFRELLASKLKIEIQDPYKTIDWKNISFQWQWSRKETKEGPDFTDDLNVVLRRTPNLKVFIAGGSYDLATPIGYAKKSTEKANFAADRVIFKEYESGHMLYLGNTGKLFSDDLRSFILSCSK
ncbi:septum formation initiator [Flavobacterium sp. ANB]|uniref:S10 family peptidase n=1 Tax=unclassified Flavobacterium TaxID=196869 RepID=UPI0012B99E86|nr:MULTISPECIES: septum formation initiator [unclassified Flavobacterium]MBF4518642.1 septum formation initiator [Flavobacterium sp. ANB]MTD67852.1 septum formation initiator [Flavobacterium sp. LC2016-13]